MICTPCRKAADTISDMLLGAPGNVIEAIQNAKIMHGHCTDCDCQHDVDEQLKGKVAAV